MNRTNTPKKPRKSAALAPERRARATVRKTKVVMKAVVANLTVTPQMSHPA